MIRPDVQKWGQTTDDLRRLATEAEHPRTRERFLATTPFSPTFSSAVDLDVSMVKCCSSAAITGAPVNHNPAAIPTHARHIFMEQPPSRLTP